MYIYIYIYIYTYVCVCVCVYIYIYIYIYTGRLCPEAKEAADPVAGDKAKHALCMYVRFQLMLQILAAHQSPALVFTSSSMLAVPLGTREGHTANLRTKILDFRFRILILSGGIPRRIGDFPESLSQAILVGIILAGRLGVSCVAGWVARQAGWTQVWQRASQREGQDHSQYDTMEPTIFDPIFGSKLEDGRFFYFRWGDSSVVGTHKLKMGLLVWHSEWKTHISKQCDGYNGKSESRTQKITSVMPKR